MEDLHNRQLSRRLFIKGVVGAGVLFAGSSILTHLDVFGNKGEKSAKALGLINVYNLRQLISRDNGSSRTILWEVDKSFADEVILEVININEADNMRFYPAQVDFFTDAGTKIYQYVVHIDGLVPGTEYEYRLATKTAATEWARLYTPTPYTAFKTLIFPDAQSGDPTDWQNLAKQAWQSNQDAQLFVNMGDLVDKGESRSQWLAWFAGVEGMQKQVAFAPVMGNHETYDLEWEKRLPMSYLSYFPVPNNGSEQFSRYYYSFDYGCVHFIVLNTQDDEIKEFKPGINEEQLAWLEKDMAERANLWNIVLMHRDVLQYRIQGRSGRTEGFSEDGVRWMPVFDRLGIDVVFSAHIHTYRNRGRIYNFDRAYTKGPLYIVTGVAGDVRYPNLWVDHALDVSIAPQPETNNYLTMEATHDHLKIKCYLPDGTEIDNIMLT